MAAKHRRNSIIGGGLVGAGAGAIGGGLLFKKLIGYNKNLHKILESECSISDKKARKTVIKKLKNNSYTDWNSFVQGLVSDGGLSLADAKKCAAFFYKESYIENVYQVIEKVFPAIDSRLYAVLDEEIYFEFNSSKFTTKRASPKVVLDKFYDALVDSDVQGCASLILIGYGSNTGTSQRNLTLGMERAERVRDYFVNQKGMNASQFTVDSKGDENDAYGNKTDDKSHNRRVDIKLDLASCASHIGVSAPGANPNSLGGGVDGDTDYRVFEGKTLVLDHNKFQTKKNFRKGAMIGAPVGGLLGAGLGALFTKYKCYLSGTDELLAKWKKNFKISPPASVIPDDSIKTEKSISASSSSFSSSTSVEMK